MKSGASAVKWRPVAGVVFAGALAMGVAAFAAPRTGESVRAGKGETRVQSEAASLVSGSGENLQAVIAGGPAGATIELYPVAARVGSYPVSANAAFGDFVHSRPLPKGPQAYNEIALNHGGFRIWAEWKYSNWDPNGNDILEGTGVCTAGACTAGLAAGACTVNADCDQPTAALMAPEIVGAGLADADINGNGDTTDDGAQPPLAFAIEQCPSANVAGNNACTAAMGGEGGQCVLPGFAVGCPFSFCCAQMWYGKNDPRPDNICGGVGDCNAACDTSSPLGNFRCFQAPTAPEVFTDTGIKKFGGYLALDVPALAKGRYFLDLNRTATIMQDRQSPPVDIPLAEESGVSVYIRVGQCCFGLGTPGASCVSEVTLAECNALPTPNLFTEGGDCSVCAECTQPSDALTLCNDGDACTDDACNVGLLLCTHALIAGFDPVTECCNPANGDIDTRDDGDVCTGDICSLPNSRGDAVNPVLPSSTPCLDGNPCTTGDHCDGVRSQADGGCGGSDVNAVACVAGVCPVLNELDNSEFACDAGTGNCFCTLTPDLDYIVINSLKNPACEGGSNAGFACEGDSDCPGGFCDPFAHGGNCFDSGDKIQTRVHIGSAGAPINGGEFLLVYDASCVTLNSITPIAPYTNIIYGPIYGNGSVFIAIGMDAFGGVDGPLGNADVLALSFTKTGTCDECELCFGDNNPQHTYLVDNEGQRVNVAPNCKGIRELPDLTLDVPGSDDVNKDCDLNTATVSWDAPSASSSCGGGVTVSCRGAHESGLQYGAGLVNGGGSLPGGASSFCCVASENSCDQEVGCPVGPVADCPVDDGTGKPAGCWTINVSDETSLDINIQLSPPIAHNDANGELTRCIKFTMFDGITDPDLTYFYADVTFGGLFNFTGKFDGKVKVPAGKWDCITAQDQLHTLRNCYEFTNQDCVGGQLSADFSGNPDLIASGNWLIGGNLDGWKKFDPTAQPSLDIIDILDFGTFMSQAGTVYGDNDTPCGTAGPNADINGDGVADSADYAFIVRNFLVDSKLCCGGPQGSAAQGVTEISVEDLQAMGHGDLAVADLNGDGLVNMADMDAYSQGARPVKTNNGRGGKGVRSGR